MVGHTHDDIDQAFSVIARYLMKQDARTIPAFEDAVRQAYSGRSNARRVDYQVPEPSLVHGIHDWKSFLDPFIDRHFSGTKKVHYFRFFRLSSGRVALRYKYWSTSEVERPVEAHEEEGEMEGEDVRAVDATSEAAYLSQREDTAAEVPDAEAGFFVSVLQRKIVGYPSWETPDAVEAAQQSAELEAVKNSVEGILSLSSGGGANAEEQDAWERFFRLASLSGADRCLHGIPFDVNALKMKSRRNEVRCLPQIGSQTEPEYDILTDSNWRASARTAAKARANATAMVAREEAEGPQPLTPGLFCFVRVTPLGRQKPKGVSAAEDGCRVALCEVVENCSDVSPTAKVHIRWWRQTQGDINKAFIPGIIPGSKKQSLPWTQSLEREMFLVCGIQVKKMKKGAGALKVAKESLMRLCAVEAAGYEWIGRQALPCGDANMTSASFEAKE